MNTVTVEGNTTRDPDLKFTAAGKALAEFGLAVNRRWKDYHTQEWHEAVTFFTVKAWGQLGENLVDSVRKGDAVIVSGRIDQENWTGKDGGKQSRFVLTADTVGASLRRATCSIVRNERRDQAQAPPPVFGDEDPF